MKKQFFAIVLILSYKLNGVVKAQKVKASTTKVSTINPTSTSTPILIKSINTPGSPICTPVNILQLSVTDSSGDNYTCDFQTLASNLTFSEFNFIGDDGFSGDDGSPGKITIQENSTGKIITLNNCNLNIQWLTQQALPSVITQ